MKHRVRDVMTVDVATVATATPFKDVVRILHDRRVSAVPVVDAVGRVLGIVSEADLALKEEHQPDDPVPFFEGDGHRRERASARGTVAADFMTEPVTTVPPEASLAVAARLLHREGIRHLPVVDADDRLVGIVTRRDLLAVFLRPDSAIHWEVERSVVEATLGLQPGTVRVAVDLGVVTLEGRLPRRSLARELVGLVNAVEGVVAVRDRVRWLSDDTIRLAATPWG
jgi:CBS domain-containing protein